MIAKRWLHTLITAVFLVAGAVVPAQAEQTRTISENWGRSGMQWSNNDGLLFRWATFPQDGKLMVCAAYVTMGGTTAQLNKQALREARLQDARTEKTITRNMTFAKLYSTRHLEGDLVGKEANCKVTDIDYTSFIPTKIKWRIGRYST